MGDHRASVKIEMEFHGKAYKTDLWINYAPDHTGIDPRIVEFFEESYEDGINRFNARAWKSQEAERNARKEADERATLAELKAKYESGSVIP